MAEADADARNRVELTAQVAAAPDEVFTYLTERFDDLWPGRFERISEGEDPKEPLGLGFVRRMHTAAGKLDEEIVTHERPRLIEYAVVDDGKVSIHNHLGRIELSERDGGAWIDYTIRFDYRPPFLGPVAARAIGATWRLRAKRRLRRAFPG